MNNITVRYKDGTKDSMKGDKTFCFTVHGEDAKTIMDGTFLFSDLLTMMVTIAREFGPDYVEHATRMAIAIARESDEYKKTKVE